MSSVVCSCAGRFPWAAGRGAATSPSCAGLGKAVLMAPSSIPYNLTFSVMCVPWEVEVWSNVHSLVGSGQVSSGQGTGYAGNRMICQNNGW